MLPNLLIPSSKAVFLAFHNRANVSNQSHAYRGGLLFQGLSLTQRHAILQKGGGAALIRGREEMPEHAYSWCLSEGAARGSAPAGWAGLLPAGVVEGFEGSEIPPCGGKAVLQKPPTALARGLEQLYVTS